MLFLLNNWRWLLPLLVVGILTAALGVQTMRLDWCKEGRAADKARLEALGAQIAEQNRAVEALRAEGARKAKEAAQALAKAEARGRVWDEQAKRLAAVLTNRREGGPKTCSEAWAEIQRR